jgi:hypothetical protein
MASMENASLRSIQYTLQQTGLAACRELLDRGYGKPRQGIEIAPPPDIDPIKMLLDEIAAGSRNENRYQDQYE